jgi:23S rRNA (guanine2445-N2)-methyltransferase / 23S rRNA (guanine2069-N7)-methyltransferase
MKAQHWFANCPRGIESLLLNELASLGAESVRETVAGCAFEGSIDLAYRVCLWSRLANRVLLPIAQFEVRDADNIHPLLLSLDWETYLPVGRSFVVDFSGQNKSIRNTQYGAQLTKDAILDRFRERGMARPEVSRQDPDVRFQLRLRKGKLDVSLDLAGASLHQRGYRLEAGSAPLKENLAAALLLRADWPAMAARGGALIDPMCGSGTLLLEAALMAADIAPGLWRQRWGFECQAWHNSEQWQGIRDDAQARAARGRALQLPEIRGYDSDRRVLLKAQANIDRIGLEKAVRVTCKPIAELKKPTHRPLPDGLVICNPPYGERLGEREALPALYRELGEVLMREFSGWRAAIFTADKELGMAMEIRSERQYSLYNGALPAQLLLFDLKQENRRQSRQFDSAAAPAELSDGAAMFSNRMRKNLQQMQRWARKQGVSCYRIYDADMPEYAVAVDRYENMLHVAEYQAPASIDEQTAEGRMNEIRQVLPLVTGVAEDDIYYKQRRRQRGRQQYEKTGKSGELVAVKEAAATLLVNLSDYLDTGLFLDHRPLRLRIAAEARDKDFLNLYCYTAPASVHAACAGARSTTSVDLSNTYLGWARKNYAANKLAEGDVHRFVRADCQQWLGEQDREYDLILLDPPSFSNSKRMQDSFDVQRDHAQLLASSLGCLRAGGVLYFSNNLRSFKLDPGLQEICNIEDISASTIDFDFRRNPRIHHCWRVTKK